MREQLSRLTDRIRLDNIRTQILVFAVLAALIPALSIAGIAYEQSRRSLVEATTQELSATTSQAARELGLWIKERLYDLRVYTGSYEVIENLERAARSPDRAARARLAGYLDAVRGRTGDYEMLAVTDVRGGIVAASAVHRGAPAAALTTLPPEWITQVRDDNPAVGTAFWDDSAAKAAITFAVPVTSANGRVLGALVAELDLGSAAELLSGFTRNGGREVYVVTDRAQLVIGSGAPSPDLMRQRLAAKAFDALRTREGERIEYRDHTDREVVGILRPVSGSRWAVLAQVPVVEAFAQVARLRNAAIGIVLVLGLGIGGLAYLLGRFIVRPLDRLTTGAAAVAGGDLGVAIPATGSGEVAYLTRVFNDMVTRLREGREELERLSITDALTKLYNRRHLMMRLDEEGRRARRTDRPFTVLMLDVDHFKKFNDTYGHHAGDEVLAGVAAVFEECVREVDCAARYGGEEFVILLPETTAEGGVDVTRRIRERLAAETFPGGRVTLSIGVAEFPADGETPEFVLRAADAALYRAKREGRDRVHRAVRGRFSGDVRSHDPTQLRGQGAARAPKTPSGGIPGN